MTHFTVKLALPLLAALTAGCTTMAAGFGSTAPEADPINFSWESSYSVAASMSSPFSDDNHYNGQLFQVTKKSTFDGAGPLWSVRFPCWSDEDHWGAAPAPIVINRYSGPTVANAQCAAW
jgi:hypothetical protein